MSHNRVIRSLALVGTAAALLVALAGLLVAAPAAPPKVTDLTIEAERVTGNKREGDVRVMTCLKAEIRHEDVVFTCDSLVDRRQGDVHEFLCTGSPSYKDKENVITGDKMTGFSSPRRAEFAGNVKIVTTPVKKAGANAADFTTDPTTTTCDNLSYDYKNKRGLAKGNVVVVQKTRTVWANEAIIEQTTDPADPAKNSKLVTLKGNVRMKDTGDSDIQEILNIGVVTIAMDTEWVDMVPEPGKKIIIKMRAKDTE